MRGAEVEWERKTYEKREEHTQKKNQSYLDTVQNNIQTEFLTLECLEGTPATNYRTKIWKKLLQAVEPDLAILMVALRCGCGCLSGGRREFKVIFTGLVDVDISSISNLIPELGR